MAAPGVRVKLTGTACVTHRDDRLLPCRVGVLPWTAMGQPGPDSGWGRWAGLLLPPETRSFLRVLPPSNQTFLWGWPRTPPK